MRPLHPRAILAGLFLCALNLQAQFTWSGSSPTNGNITDSLNWVGGIAPTSSTTLDLTFDTSGAQTNVIFPDFAVRNITLGASRPAYTFLSDTFPVPKTLTLNGNLTALSGNLAVFNSSLAIALPTGTHNFDIVGGPTLLAIYGNLSGAGSLLKAGTGSLTLAGTNTYTGGTTVTFGTLTVDTGSINHAGVDLFVGNASGDNGTLAITNGGDVTNGSGLIGMNAGSTGAATVTGIGSTWTNNNYFRVGEAGTGSLTITNGGFVSTPFATIGEAAGSSGTVTVDGSGSSMLNSAEFVVGNFGTGLLAITNNGIVTSNSHSNLGYSVGGIGTATVDGVGSSWVTAGDLRVGYFGTGSIAITNGGGVTTGVTGLIGTFAGGTGTVTVDGANSYWNSSSGVIVGYSTTGSLTLANTGSVGVTSGAGTVTLGLNSGGAGTLNIGGPVVGPAAAGGILNAATITTGSGTGTLRFKTTATSGTPYYLTKNGTAGGAAVLVTGPTQVINTAGYNVLTGANTYTVGTTVNFGTLSVFGGSITHTGAFQNTVVGELTGDIGTLAIINGGDVSNYNGLIGSSSGSTGTADVDGAGSTWTNLRLYVGHNGAGSLNITNGGSVSSTSSGYIGTFSGGSGTVTVNGAGSSLANSDLNVGNSGSGTLTLSNGGIVSANGGLGPVYLASNTGSDGTLNIGAAAASAAAAGGIVNAASIGTVAGTGTLQFKTTASTGTPYYLTKDGTAGGAAVTITGATQVINTAGYNVLKGANTYTGGTTIKNGGLYVDAGSITHAAANTTVGQASGDSGDLLVTNGGDATNFTGTVGNLFGSLGTVEVSGAGSTWTNTNYLYVGAAGQGSLSLDAGGTVSSPNVSIGNNAGGSGFLTVADVGSALNIANTIYVGSEGYGSLDIISGGLATSVTGSIGNNAGGTGDTFISGAGSAWTNSGSLLIGNAATGYVDIRNQATVSAANATIGVLAGIDGSVILQNTGTFGTTGNLVIGAAGLGYLQAETGSTITTGGQAIIGNNAGGDGLALLLDSATSWTIASDLIVGNAGSGTLHLFDSATLNVGGGSGTIRLSQTGTASGTFFIGYDGGTYQPGGVINAADITTGLGVGQLVFGTTSTRAAPYYLTKDGTVSGANVVISGPTQVSVFSGHTVLSGTNTYTGGTTLQSGGTVVAASNSALGTGGVFFYGGNLLVAPGVTFANTINFGVGGGTLGGSGIFGNSITAGTDVHLAPGNSPGILSFSSGLTLASGGFLDFEVQTAAGPAGTGYDLVSVSGAVLNITATSIAPYTINLISLNAGATAGAVADFSAASPYSWTIATSAAGITNFAADKFFLNTASFTNGLGGGSFFVAQLGNNLVLNFTPVPEPSTYALLALGLASLACRWRRRLP